MRALFEAETPVQYATPRILLILPGLLLRCRVLGRRTWLANRSSTTPPPPFPPGPAQDRCNTRSSILAGGIPKRPNKGRMAVRNVSTEGSPVSVDDVITPGPMNRTFI